MSIDYKLIGDSIRARRNEFGFTQKKVAEKASISQGYIADLENGNIKNPSLKALDKVAEILQINLDRLFTAVEKEKKEELYITNQETKLLEKYRMLSVEQQIKVEGIIEGMLMSADEADKKGA